MPAKETAKAEPVTDGGVVQVPAELQTAAQVRDFLAFAAEQSTVDADPEAAALAIVERIMGAASADEVLGGPGVTHARDFLDRPHVVRGVTYHKSAFVEGLGVFAVVEAVTHTGEGITYTVGSTNVLTQLLKLQQLGAIPTPKPVRLVQTERPTAAGYYPLWLEYAP